MMRKLIAFLFCLGFYLGVNGQCGLTLPDTASNNTATLITATTARLNADVSNGDVGGNIVTVRYVRVGQTDTVVSATAWPTSIRNITGLQPNTVYVYYYSFACGGYELRQLGRYYFTTLNTNVVYAAERSTSFPYVKVDSGFKIPRMSTLSLYRATSTGGDIAYKTSDSLPYYYNGVEWKVLAVDSAGILPMLNRKVDSVTVSSDSLWYWINGVSYGYILPTANNWSRTGNSGTTPGTNFLGTTDGVGLMFKVNSTQAGYIDVDNANTSLGEGTLLSNTTGNNNVAIGYNSSNDLTEGTGNVSVGASTLNSVVTGNYNTAIGEGSLNLSSGSNNIALGRYSGRYLTSESDRLIINSINRTDKANDTTKSIIYGAQDATAANQRLYLNSQVYLPYLTSAVGTKALRYNPTSGLVTYADTTTSSGGTVTSIATGLGLSGGTITNSGTILLDTANASVLSRQRAANTYQPLLPSYTLGSVLFSDGTTIAQDNANLYWDTANKRLGIGTATPSYALHVNGDSRIYNESTGNGFLSNGGVTQIGDVGGNVNGNTLQLEASARVAYFTNDENNIKVGINTISPSVALDVKGAFDNINGDIGDEGTRIQNGGGEIYLLKNVGGDPSSFLKLSTGQIYVNNVDNLLNFGINTSTPSVALDVVGQVNISQVLKLEPMAYANLPTGVTGMIAVCNDLDFSSMSSGAWGATAVSGGSDIGTLFYNGTNWTLMGK